MGSLFCSGVNHELAQRADPYPAHLPPRTQRRDRAVPIRWGAGTPKERGPIIGSVTTPADRNVIGAHGGSYSLYRALAISARALNPLARPDLHNTHPTTEIGPHPQWSERGGIVSLDPWGHLVGQAFADEIAQGVDIRPTIAITKAGSTCRKS